MLPETENGWQNTVCNMPVKFTKQQGYIHQHDRVMSSIEAYFNTLKNGEYILTAKQEKDRRSISQNSLMWMWFECISRETGQNRLDIYDYYRTMYLSRIITVNEKEVQVSSGTSSLDTKQFTEFLNHVQADAASEFGIKLPTPEDLYWEEFSNEYKNNL